MNSDQRASQSFRLAIITFALLLTLAGAAGTAPAQTYTDLHDFNSGAGDPANLVDTGLLPQGRDGNLYGVSAGGGTSGTVYNVTAAGTPTVLASLNSTTGDAAVCGLTLGSDGNFYGVAPSGGTSNVGTAYRVAPTGALTVLHNFTNNGDGGVPTCPPVQAADGNLYGVTTGFVSGIQGVSTFYKITLAGAFSTLHIFANSEGQHCSALTQGTDGYFYGACELDGANGKGTLYKISAAGKVSVLHNFTGSDGFSAQGEFLVQAKDGNFYGTSYQGGSSNFGVIFRLSPTGTYKVLYNFTGGADGGNPQADMEAATDGNLYGTASVGGSTTGCSTGCGVIFKITTAGVFTVLHTFDSTHGSDPQSNLTQRTDGLLYGNTLSGGAKNEGVFYSLNLGLSPFITLQSTSGKAGSSVGIFGQGFSASSVVKFNGVAATAAVLSGTTYITAKVPAGSSTGFVTVTTGSTTLTSTQKYLVHDSWSAGAPMPTAAIAPCAAVLRGQTYVVGGYNSSPLTAVQIYNPATNKWTAGTGLPTGLSNQACAGVRGAVYEFGGTINNGASQTNAVLAYSPAAKTWSSKAAMPNARQDIVAVVSNNLVYVIGGYNGNRLATVDVYDPATDTWKSGSPLLTPQSGDVGGLISGRIVISGGAGQSVDTGDTESFNASGNTWTAVKADPNVRNNPCGGAVGTTLYVAGGANRTGNGLSVNESFSPSKNSWTTFSPLPQATIDPASAVSGGLLYCFGGEASTAGIPINEVQIYQP